MDEVLAASDNHYSSTQTKVVKIDNLVASLLDTQHLKG